MKSDSFAPYLRSSRTAPECARARARRTRRVRLLEANGWRLAIRSVRRGRLDVPGLIAARGGAQSRSTATWRAAAAGSASAAPAISPAVAGARPGYGLLRWLPTAMACSRSVRAEEALAGSRRSRRDCPSHARQRARSRRTCFDAREHPVAGLVEQAEQRRAACSGSRRDGSTARSRRRLRRQVARRRHGALQPALHRWPDGAGLRRPLRGAREQRRGLLRPRVRLDGLHDRGEPCLRGLGPGGDRCRRVPLERDRPRRIVSRGRMEFAVRCDRCRGPCARPCRSHVVR